MIRFHTKVHADVVMFDKVALQLIKLMGRSATVPSALAEDEVAEALTKLKAAVSQPTAQQGDSWDDDGISLAHRAQPLIHLLDAAEHAHTHVIWEVTLR